MISFSPGVQSVIRIAAALVIFYAIVLAAVFLKQRWFLYHPSTASLESSFESAKTQNLQAWRNSAGEVIGWKRVLNGQQAPHRALVLHGNAGSAVDRVGYVMGLESAGTWDVYILEYPGYGARSGSPSQESLFQAADEAMALLEKEGPIYVVGESLGTGVAAYLAGTHPKTVAGLLMVAPYHNMTDVAQFHMPMLPVRLLLLDRFESAVYLRNYKGPMAVLLAASDEIVPSRFGRQLYDAYQGPKKLWEMPRTTHNSLSYEPPPWWRELMEFWKATSS